MLNIVTQSAFLELYNPVVEAALQALAAILTVEGVLVLLVGTFIGLFFGALPGFGGMLALALVFPYVYQLPPELGFMLIAATLGGGAFGASLPAIALNVPGLPSNIATCWDGNKMTQNGEMSRAIGASASSSVLGAMVGLVLLIVLLPVLQELILLFAAPEIFAVAIVGLVIIALLARDAPIRGMIALFLGISLAFIGIESLAGEVRYTLFGHISGYLYSGISLIPVVVGIYALGEAIRLTLHVERIGESEGGETSDHTSVFHGIRDTFQNKLLFLRSSALGWAIGLIPGVGGMFANVMAYTQGKSLSKTPDKWGTGIPQGVIAPEASNDAKDGGAVIPTITFGVPGSGAQVFFLAGMTANGIFPGTDMLTSELHITMSIIFGLLFSNIVTSTFGLFAGGAISRTITKLRPKPIAAGTVLIALLGTYSINANFYNIVFALIFGVVGYMMWRYNYPRILFIIAFVLGPIIEKMFGQSYQLFGPTFLLRPTVLAILAVGSFAILWSHREQIQEVISV